MAKAIVKQTPKQTAAPHKPPRKPDPFKGIPEDRHKTVAMMWGLRRLYSRQKVTPQDVYVELVQGEIDDDHKREEQEQKEASWRAAKSLEIPMVSKLGVDGPVPEEVRSRLDRDLTDAQFICKSLQDLCHQDLSELDIDQFSPVVEAMAYRVGRLLDMWTGFGTYRDEAERRIEVEKAAAVQEAAHGA
jgi:hypothetical protein